MKKITKKYATSIKEMLTSSKFTTGYKTQKCADIRQFIEDNKKSKLCSYEFYTNVIMYANLNRILFNGRDGKI